MTSYSNVCANNNILIYSNEFHSSIHIPMVLIKNIIKS